MTITPELVREWLDSDYLGTFDWYTQFVSNLAKAYLALAEQREWQDIKDAPKDGYLLLYCADGFFCNDSTMEIGTYEQWHKTATHWQPLPQPPGGAE